MIRSDEYAKRHRPWGGAAHTECACCAHYSTPAHQGRLCKPQSQHTPYPSGYQYPGSAKNTESNSYKYEYMNTWWKALLANTWHKLVLYNCWIRPYPVGFRFLNYWDVSITAASYASWSLFLWQKTQRISSLFESVSSSLERCYFLNIASHPHLILECIQTCLLVKTSCCFYSMIIWRKIREYCENSNSASQVQPYCKHNQECGKWYWKLQPIRIFRALSGWWLSKHHYDEVNTT